MKPEISQKELSYLLEMRPQSMGELLAKLEKKGYIDRTPSEADRRVLNIKLTKEGEEAVEESTESDFSFDKVLECLNDDEQQNLGIYLDRIIETLESYVDEEMSEPNIALRMRGVNPLDRETMDSSRAPVQGDFDPRVSGGWDFFGGIDRGGKSGNK
jgi:DNA-binding MarR family transcriptional regulator